MTASSKHNKLGLIATIVLAVAWCGSTLAEEKTGEKAAAPKAETIELNEKTHKDIIRKILPDPVEDKWKEVGWRTFFWDAVKEAEQLQRPVLLWTMNGHPCAKT